MEVSPRFFVLDTVMIDVVLKISSLPLRGSDALVTNRLVTAGGGFNAMSAAARQGMAVTYVGQVGGGPFADIALDALREQEIEVAVQPRGDQDLGICIVLVEGDGERTFVTSPGAEGTLSASDLLSVAIGDGDYVFFSGYNFVYPQIRGEMMTWLRQLSSRVVVAFDPGPRVLDIPAEVLREVMARTDWFLCNAGEASSLTGDECASASAERLLATTGRRGVVVRDGVRGCVLARADQAIVEVPGVPTQVVDTNGAGDVHNGVLLAELARGTTYVEALRRANVGAAIAISAFGPATCPSREVVSEKLARSS